MMEPPAFDDLVDTAIGSEGNAIQDALYPFNPLTDGLNDLQIAHQQCWLWPQIKLELDRLDEVIGNAHTFVEPLTHPDCSWGQAAAWGIARSNTAIHQHVEHHGSYPKAARSLWTTRIPSAPPTLSDAQIYAILAIHEARMAAETYCEIAAGIEEELQEAGICHDDEENIGWVRSEIAGWECSLWHDAAQQTGTAEKFLLMADFVARTPDPVSLQRAESQLATLRRKASAAKAAVEPFRRGRKEGAISNFSRALNEISRDAGSKDLEAVLTKINEYLGEDIQGIRFDDIDDEEQQLFYTDLTRNRERSIAMDSLKRRLRNLPDV
jgi:hypothetical protein